MSLAVVTDSSSCLPTDLARACGIGVVPLLATTGDGNRPGSTSRPSLDELAHAYAHAAEGADEVLALHLTASLSGTVDAATRAALPFDREATRVEGSSAGARLRSMHRFLTASVPLHQ